ncbi:MAG TPA: hypothetical protein VGF60_10255 [Xanthobacteraceae bacterium]|jgi:hypothetical protein
MTKAAAAVLAAVLGLGLSRLPDGGAAGVARAQQAAAQTLPAGWTEVKWPFPIDQWGTGRAFRCPAADCGAALDLYLRPKLGFCNCTTGVADDPELDRVGDLELFSASFSGLREGRPVKVGWMRGRSRPYEVAIPRGGARTMLAIAFNDKCDVVVATAVADRDQLDAAERAALAFLNGDLVLRWAKRELGL